MAIHIRRRELVVTLCSAAAAWPLELLRELVPTAKLIAVMANPTNLPGNVERRDVEAAARAVGQRIVVSVAMNLPAEAGGTTGWFSRPKPSPGHTTASSCSRRSMRGHRRSRRRGTHHGNGRRRG